MADFIDRQRRSAQQGLQDLRSTLRNTPTNPQASPGSRPRGFGIAGANQAPVTMSNEGKPPKPSPSFRVRFNAAKRKLQQGLKAGVVGDGGMRKNLGLDPKPKPRVPAIYNQSPDPIGTPPVAAPSADAPMTIPRPLSLADREPTSLMPPAIARNDSTAELMASRRTLRQNPLDLAKVRQSQMPPVSSMMEAEADKVNARAANIESTVDSIARGDYLQGGVDANNRERARQEAFRQDLSRQQEEIANMRQENYASENSFDMTKQGPYGKTDVVVRPRSATENFNSRLASMSPEELKREAFTSRQSGLRGSGAYGGRATYTQPGGMAGREAALAGSSLDYGAGTGPVEQSPRKPVDMGTRAGAYADSNDDGQISDSEMAAVEARMRTRRAERLGLPTTPEEKAQAFQAQRDRRDQRREDALATRRSMLPYRTRGIPMNAIFLNESGQADPLMNAGMFKEASNRDQANAQRAELARQFDAEQATREQTVANQKLEIENRNSYNTERNEIERKRVEGEISNNEANREMDQAKLKFEQKEARRQRRQEQRDKEKFEEIEDVELYGAQNESLAQNKSPVQGMYREGTGSERIENLERMLASESLTPAEKKRLMSYQFGITDQEQLNQLLEDAGYEEEGYFRMPTEYSSGSPLGLLNVYQSPRTYRIRNSILGNSSMAFAAQ